MMWEKRRKDAQTELERLYDVENKYNEMKNAVRDIIVMNRRRLKLSTKVKKIEEMLKPFEQEEGMRADKYSVYYDRQKKRKRCVHCGEAVKQKPDGTYYTLCERHLKLQRERVRKMRGT